VQLKGSKIGVFQYLELNFGLRRQVVSLGNDLSIDLVIFGVDAGLLRQGRQGR
jgi:hypothetical protein